MGSVLYSQSIWSGIEMNQSEKLNLFLQIYYC